MSLHYSKLITAFYLIHRKIKNHMEDLRPYMVCPPALSLLHHLLPLSLSLCSSCLGLLTIPKMCPPPSYFRAFALTLSLGMACSLTPFRCFPLPYQRGLLSAHYMIVNLSPAVTLYSLYPTLLSLVPTPITT